MIDTKIFPKEGRTIPIKNIYYMLAYAFDLLTPKDEIKIEIKEEEFENFQSLMAAILAACIEKQLKRGLYRAYIDNVADMPRFRGKLNIHGTIRNRAQAKNLLTCEFDELSEDVLLNQILKTTSLLLLRTENVAEDQRNSLKKCLVYFGNVQTIDARNIPWDNIQYNRNNVSYELPIAICMLVIEGMILEEDYENEECHLIRFVENNSLWMLYEKFLLGYYRTEHPELETEDRQMHWDDSTKKDNSLPAMHTDVVLTKDTGNEIKALVIEAKCYKYILNKASSLRYAHIYQLFAYIMNLQSTLEKSNPGRDVVVSGLLLYAFTNEKEKSNAEGAHTVFGHRMDIKTLDLTQDFDTSIRHALDSLVTEYLS